MDIFLGLADNTVKIKESENIDKHLDLARELKKLWNVKVGVIPLLVGELGTVIKGLEWRRVEFEI